jgi:hypothetical protein
MTDEWYVARRGQDGSKRYGPVPLQQLRELLDAGKVRGEDLVWREGMAAWQRADQCDALFPPAPAPRQDYAREPAPRDYAPPYDRPYRRRDAPPPSSAGWVVGLVVVLGVVVVCFLGCGGAVLFWLYAVRTGPSTYTTSTSSTSSLPPAVKDDAMVVKPNLGGGAPLDQDRVLNYNLSRLYYTGNVTDLQAQDLGAYLDNQGVFPLDHGVTVVFDFQNGSFLVRFCVKPGATWNEDVVNYYRNLRTDIQDLLGASPDFFVGAVVVAELCDENMNTVRTLRAGD